MMEGRAYRLSSCMWKAPNSEISRATVIWLGQIAYPFMASESVATLMHRLQNQKAK